MTNALKAPIAGSDPLASDVGQFANLFNALLDAGVLQLASPQTAPSAPTATASGNTGNLNGAYMWKTVLVTGWKQGDGSYYVSGFAPSTDSTSITVTNGSVTVSAIATGTSVVIGRAIYRTIAGGAAGTEKFAGILWDNGTTTWTDNIADSSLGTGMPSSSSSPTAYGIAIPADVPTVNTTGTLLNGDINAGDLSAANPTFVGSQIFTSSDTFTVPEGVSRVFAQVWGAGGGGGGAYTQGSGGSAYSGASGAGGGYGEGWIEVSPGQQISVTVGAEGTGGVGGGNGVTPSYPAPGGNGGNSSFGTYVTGDGGQGGSSGTSISSTGSSGGSGSGTFTANGQDGSGNGSGPGGNGATDFGGAGGAKGTSSSINGVPGNSPGGGGGLGYGASITSVGNGANGARGEVRVYY